MVSKTNAVKQPETCRQCGALATGKISYFGHCAEHADYAQSLENARMDNLLHGASYENYD